VECCVGSWDLWETMEVEVWLFGYIEVLGLKRVRVRVRVRVRKREEIGVLFRGRERSIKVGQRGDGSVRFTDCWVRH